MNYLILVLLLVILWVALIYYLAPYLKKTKNFSPYGPALMIKLTRNRGILDKVSNKFPAKLFSRISVVLVLASAVVAIFMLAYGIYLGIGELRTGVSSSGVPLTELIGLPGINPVIPIGFGTAALVFSVVIHEVFHGIVARKHGITVKSVGALFFIIPVGAFVEPDEKEITEADPVVRRRIVAAGPGINVIIAFVSLALLIFLIAPSVHPVSLGGYVEQSSSHNIPISTGSEIISLGNYTGNSLNNLNSNSTLIPGKFYPSTYILDGKRHNTDIAAGVMIVSTLTGFPAHNNLSVNGIIAGVDGHIIYNQTGLTDILNNVEPGRNVTITEVIIQNYSSQSSIVKNVTMPTVAKSVYYAKYDPSANQPDYKNQSFIGVTVEYAGLGIVPIQNVSSAITGRVILSNPTSDFLSFLGLPFYGFSPVPSYLASLFSVPVSPLIFWGIMNSLYWLFWLNFLLGITNALPFVVLDGGQFFRDTLIIGERRKSLSFLKSDRVKNAISVLLNILVFVLLMGSVLLASHGV